MAEPTYRTRAGALIAAPGWQGAGVREGVYHAGQRTHCGACDTPLWQVRAARVGPGKRAAYLALWYAPGDVGGVAVRGPGGPHSCATFKSQRAALAAALEHVPVGVLVLVLVHWHPHARALDLRVHRVSA